MSNSLGATNSKKAPPSVNSKAKKALLAVNFFVETNRMEAFVAVYFIVFKEWSTIQIGILSLVSNIVMILFQTPAGDLLDKSSHKRGLMAVSILVASITTASVGWTSNFWIVLVIKTIEGLAATTFLPGLISLLLGICLTKEETPRFIASCEVSNKIGSILFILGSGLIAHFLYPDIASIFYLLGAGGVLAAFFTMMIPTDAINNDRARQAKIVEKPSDEENTSKSNDAGIKSDEKTTETISYCELLQNRSICFFAVLTFIYHLGNASVAPIVAQFLAIENERTAMLFASATMLVFFIAQAITAHLVKYALDICSAKSLLILAHLALPVRCALLAVMINIWNNKFAICATQILDGIGAGLYDTMIPIVVAKMTGDTGRFGFAFGFIVTAWRLGHGFSLFLGETVLHASSYEVTFIMQGGIGVASLVLLIMFVHIPNDTRGLKVANVSDTFMDNPTDKPTSTELTSQGSEVHRRSQVRRGSQVYKSQMDLMKQGSQVRRGSMGSLATIGNLYDMGSLD